MIYIECINGADPARPTGTAPRTEDQLPYHPLLFVDPATSLLNYNRPVRGVEGIHCAPTSLESTSLVFARGLDLFFTRTAPSKRFDVLSEDFNRGYLLLSLVLLAGATYVAGLRSAAASLKAAWA